LLVLFSWVSGTFEGKIITRSWTRAVYDVAHRWVVGRRKRGKML